METKNPFLKYFKLVGRSIHYRGPEPQNLKEAFLISIAKWEFICSLGPELSLLAIYTGASDTCGLCMFSEMTDADTCDSCPIFKKTRKLDCEGTPYEKYANANTEKSIRKNARKELNFLKALYESYRKRKKL